MIHGCLKQITSYWLPLIRQACEEDSTAKPVIIVGNKVCVIFFSLLLVQKEVKYHFFLMRDYHHCSSRCVVDFVLC